VVGHVDVEAVLLVDRTGPSLDETGDAVSVQNGFSVVTAYLDRSYEHRHN
jgi:hypothetical protein